MQDIDSVEFLLGENPIPLADPQEVIDELEKLMDKPQSETDSHQGK